MLCYVIVLARVHIVQVKHHENTYMYKQNKEKNVMECNTWEKEDLANKLHNPCTKTKSKEILTNYETMTMDE